MDTSTSYLGMSIKNPIVVGSSGLSGTVEGVRRLAENGAGAVVLKSLFQEEINLESDKVIRDTKAADASVKYFDYDGRKNPIEFYGYKVREDNLNRYTTLIRESKASVDIPVIASINCYSDSLEWIAFARELERAGADALELNMFFSPTQFSQGRKDKEELYFKIIEKILGVVSIPVVLKISHYFTDLGPMIQKLSQTGIHGLVLFNRFFSPDVDIKKIEVVPSYLFSTPAEMALSLRWVAIMAEKVDCALVASTGVHDGAGVVKQILAGADVVQVVSTLYKNGVKHLGVMIEELETWMGSKGIQTIADFRGRLSQEKSSDPSVYERAQFMKYYADKKRLTVK
ncbi:dihydroorotate dehydrogenase-like protein [Desulfoluna butyratoxydans]|uniref:Dihydroorotate dehydrogenase domain n=1 Tax=Desulfoluna butyratoxydans TaxID=231438 RepID=A0A4U8YSW4_9BACT|nr:dihydroorotate dehydrogenase-like protein [Desulfoluna butyratoxydans]VFQ44942.1 dihydroorotate dehydrogenase domain [Desulfoluna butyratoxydans]